MLRLAPTHLGWDTRRQFTRRSRDPPESKRRQEVPDGRKESPGGPWEFMGLLPLFDPPRKDSADTISKALDLGVNVKMITGLPYLFMCTFS